MDSSRNIAVFSNKSIVYDLLYAGKNYKNEAAILHDLIAKNKRSDGSALLDMGCGTGKHLHYLANWYECTGIDLNQELLNIASTNAPSAHFARGNMMNFHLDKSFDAIICLFSTISYAETSGNLARAIHAMAQHLRVGGVLIIEPWFLRGSKSFIVNRPYMTVYDGEDYKIVRISVARLEGDLSIMDTRYLMSDDKGNLDAFSEEHRMALFSQEEYMQNMNDSGLEVHFIKSGLNDEGRGLYLGIKRGE